MDPMPPQLAVLNPLLPTRKEMSEEKRLQVYMMLLQVSLDGVLPHGAFTRVATELTLDANSVSKMWKRARSKIRQGLTLSEAVKSERSHRHPPSAKYIPELCAEEMTRLALGQRTNYRDTASALSIPTTTFHRIVKNNPDLFRVHTSPLFPDLKDQNKFSRIEFVLSKIGDNGFYKDLYDEVHIDEKWFYLTKDHKHYILTCSEEDPHRTTQHKGHIPKVMFLCAVARPRYYGNNNQFFFDGKIGIWPIGENRPARNNTVNRLRGTMIWHNMSLDRIMYRNMVINKVLPAIKQKFPVTRGASIIFQQDNAPAHIKPDDAMVLQKLHELHLDLNIVNQPPNSPDTNINDLAFFNALQTMHLKNPSYDSTQLIAAVELAFDRYEPYKIDYSFLTLQCCFNSIIELNGGNDYKIEHMNKDGLRSRDELPVSVQVTNHARFWTDIIEVAAEEGNIEA
jgi:hypothetical protein